jgi:hypothetical protein
LITQAEAVHYQAGSEFLPLIEEVINTLAAASPSLIVVYLLHLELRCAWFLPCMALGCQHMWPN